MMRRRKISKGIGAIPLRILDQDCRKLKRNKRKGEKKYSSVGLLSTSFATYAFISIVENKYALAAFCLTVVGALMSYTWFNIFPARFFMGDVGAFESPNGKELQPYEQLYGGLSASGWNGAV